MIFKKNILLILLVIIPWKHLLQKISVKIFINKDLLLENLLEIINYKFLTITTKI